MKTEEELGIFWHTEERDKDGKILFSGQEEANGLYIFISPSKKIGKIPSLEEYKNKNVIDYYYRYYQDYMVITIKINNTAFVNWLKFLRDTCFLIKEYIPEVVIWGGGEYCPISFDSSITDEDIYLAFYNDRFICNSDLNEEYRPLSEQQLNEIHNSIKDNNNS